VLGGQNTDGYTDGRLGLFLMVAGIAAAVGAIAAALSSSVDSPHLLVASPWRVMARAAEPSSAFRPMGEGGLWTGLLTWAIPLLILGAGLGVLDGDIVPRGMPAWVPWVVLVSGGLFVIYGALVGLWAGANYRVRPGARRAVGVAVIAPLALLPLVALAGVNMAEALRWAPMRSTVQAIAGYVGGLSPMGVPLFVGRTGLTDPTSLALRLGTASTWIHPYGVAAAASVVLPVLQVLMVWRAWRRNAKAFAAATKPAPERSIMDEPPVAGE
jgi:hypothetical protein